MRYEDTLRQIEALDPEPANDYLDDVYDAIETLYAAVNAEVQEKQVELSGVGVIEVSDDPHGLSAVKDRLLYQSMMAGAKQAEDGAAFADHVRAFHRQVREQGRYSSPEEDVEELVETVFAPLLGPYTE